LFAKADAFGILREKFIGLIVYQKAICYLQRKINCEAKYGRRIEWDLSCFKET